MGNASGAVGEEAAAEFLVKKGFRVVSRNYHSRFGEVDIIAENGQYILFAEVKTREPNAMVGPFEAVTPSKQRKLIKTALFYLQTHRTALQPRFDVIGVTTEPGGRVQSIEHLPNAFSARGFL